MRTAKLKKTSGVLSACLATTPYLCFPLLAVLLSGCGCGSNSYLGPSTNLASSAWVSLSQITNGYNHQEHLAELLREANNLIATNQAVFGQSKAEGIMARDNPLRPLLGIPRDEPSYMHWWQSADRRGIIVRSSKTDERFGEILVNLQTGRIDSVHDVKALVLIDEMERRLRRIADMREEALRLFGNSSINRTKLEEQQAKIALAEALFIPTNTNFAIQMSAPGGSNGGTGYLILVTDNGTNGPGILARANYAPRHSFGLGRSIFRLGVLRLGGAWTNLNTQAFLLDRDGIPYPRAPK